MKSIPFLLMILLIIGCSSNWGTNPTDQEHESTAVATLQSDDVTAVPVSDIEPGTPLCETEFFGYIELQNTSRWPVRCVIGDEISVIVQPNVPSTVQLSMGYREVQWWPNEHSYYTCIAAVPQCKSTVNWFDPARACYTIKDR